MCAAISWSCPGGRFLIQAANLTDLATIAGGRLAGVLPANSARLSPGDFLAMARGSLGPAFGGTFSFS